MEEDDIELITEWPVTSSGRDDDDSYPLTSLTSEHCQHVWPQPKTGQRPGKRRHQFLSADIAAKHFSDLKESKNSTDVRSWTEGDNLHPELCNINCSSNVALKLPRISSSETELNTDYTDKILCNKNSPVSCNADRNSDERKNVNNSAVHVRFVPKHETVEDIGNSVTSCLTEKQDKESSVHTFTSPELLAQPRIARWWRRQGQRMTGFTQQEKRSTLPVTTNPNTLLFHVARLPEGQAFLADERRQLKKRLDAGESSADVIAALGSIEEWLGNPNEAVQCLKQALTKEPGNKEWQWLLHKVQRQQRVRHRQTELLASVSLHPVFPSAQQVERVSCKDLSFSDFFHSYALCRRPVIITDMVSAMTTVLWDLQHVTDVAGDCQVRVKQAVPGSVEWAGLEDSKLLKVSEFLNSLQQGCRDYLFDWSLPLHCPRLAEELTIPRYFAGDFLQRSAAGSLYKDSWPSLFIAPSGVHSGLHVDAFASNFWMALFQGRKRWVFFHQEDTPCLYPIYAHSLDPTFEANVVDPDPKTHPLLSHVHPMECVLNAGELLFVPGGSPHYVENLDTTLAISANFVDLSNFTRVLDELDVSALLDPRADDLAQQFRHPSFVSSMKSDMTNLPWSDFKKWPPTDVDTYDLKYGEYRERILKATG